MYNILLLVNTNVRRLEKELTKYVLGHNGRVRFNPRTRYYHNTIVSHPPPSHGGFSFSSLFLMIIIGMHKMMII